MQRLLGSMGSRRYGLPKIHIPQKITSCFSFEQGPSSAEKWNFVAFVCVKTYLSFVLFKGFLDLVCDFELDSNTSISLLFKAVGWSENPSGGASIMWWA